MTSTLLLMTCALAAPADAPAVLPTAPMVASAGGCGSCGVGTCPGTQDPCPFEKKGLFARLRNAFRPKDKCVECLPPAAKDKSHGLFSRFHRPVNYCGAGGCGTAVAAPACDTCALPAIPGSVTPAAPAVTPAPMPAPAPAAPAGEGKPATGKVSISVPAVPAPMPGPAAKPAF